MGLGYKVHGLGVRHLRPERSRDPRSAFREWRARLRDASSSKAENRDQASDGSRKAADSADAHKHFGIDARHGGQRPQHLLLGIVDGKLTVAFELFEYFRFLAEQKNAVGIFQSGFGGFGFPIVGRRLRGGKESAVEFSGASVTRFR